MAKQPTIPRGSTTACAECFSLPTAAPARAHPSVLDATVESALLQFGDVWLHWWVCTRFDWRALPRLDSWACMLGGRVRGWRCTCVLTGQLGKVSGGTGYVRGTLGDLTSPPSCLQLYYLHM